MFDEWIEWNPFTRNTNSSNKKKKREACVCVCVYYTKHLYFYSSKSNIRWYVCLQSTCLNLKELGEKYKNDCVYGIYLNRDHAISTENADFDCRRVFGNNFVDVAKCDKAR